MERKKKRLWQGFPRAKACLPEGQEVNGFTLIELLVVIAIISLLAGQLLPSLSVAREKGRQANCISNLKQFSLAIEMFYQDYKEDYPPWLSSLYPSYISSKGVYECLTDLNRGAKGHGNESFPETNDIPPPNIDGADYEPPYAGDIAGFNDRNPDITACSYFYEFNNNKCSWFHSSQSETDIAQADINNDGSVTWKEAKIWQLTDRSYGGKVPIVRCFWHHNNYGQKVLNLSSGNYNVFTSGPHWESTSY